jgi:hypothetical protein
VGVVARISDQRNALGVSRQIRLLAGVVATEQQLGRIVAAVKKRVADRPGAVEAFEVGARSAEVQQVRAVGMTGEVAAVGGDVVGDELAEERPSRRRLQCVRAARSAVGQPTRDRELEQPCLVSLQRLEVPEEPLVAPRRAGERSVDRPRRREAVVFGGFYGGRRGDPLRLADGERRPAALSTPFAAQATGTEPP